MNVINCSIVYFSSFILFYFDISILSGQSYNLYNKQAIFYLKLKISRLVFSNIESFFLETINLPLVYLFANDTRNAEIKNRIL